MNFSMFLLALQSFLQPPIKPISKSYQGCFAGRKGIIKPRFSFVFPGVFEGLRRQGRLVGIGVIEGPLFHAGPFADGIDRHTPITLPPHKLVESLLEFDRSWGVLEHGWKLVD
jgi:hypothetical protein